LVFLKFYVIFRLMKINIDKEKLNRFCRENGIIFVVLFGSRAKEDKEEKLFIRQDSDFDIAVLTVSEKNIRKNMDNYNNILLGLCDILDIPDYKMDLTNLNNANILLKYHITSTGVLLYGNQINFEELKADAFRDYMDAKPLFNLERFLIDKKQKLLTEILARG